MYQRVKSTELLERNKGANPHDFGLSNNFLDP